MKVIGRLLGSRESIWYSTLGIEWIKYLMIHRYTSWQFRFSYGTRSRWGRRGRLANEIKHKDPHLHIAALRWLLHFDVVFWHSQYGFQHQHELNLSLLWNNRKKALCAFKSYEHSHVFHVALRKSDLQWCIKYWKTSSRQTIASAQLVTITNYM